MILLYPIGIPVLFAVLLLKRRDKINPPLLDVADLDLNRPSLAATVSTETVIESSGDSGGRGMKQPSPGTGDERGDVEACGSAAAAAGTETAAVAVAVAAVQRSERGRSSKSIVSDGADGERRLLRFGSGSGSSNCHGFGSGKDGGHRRSGRFVAAGAALNREEVREPDS